MSLYSRIVARNLQVGDIISPPGASLDRAHYHVTEVDTSNTYLVKVTAREATRPMIFGPGDQVRIAKRSKGTQR